MQNRSRAAMIFYSTTVLVIISESTEKFLDQSRYCVLRKFGPAAYAFVNQDNN